MRRKKKKGMLDAAAALNRKMKILLLFAIVPLITNGQLLNIGKQIGGYCVRDDRENWSYHGFFNGPKRWPQLFPACRGDNQSPVDIRTNKLEIDEDLSELDFTGYDQPLTDALVTNDGHSIRIDVKDDVRRSISIENTEYVLQQFHFHWGSANRPGAEHTIDGFRHTLEIHFVHSNGNQIAVVGVLVEVDSEKNAAFEPIVEVLPEVLYKDTSAQLQTPLVLSSLLPQNRNFYRYTGSLTTPTCDEGVIWSVMEDILNIGQRQLDYFLKIYSVEQRYKNRACLLAGNYRPLQRRNGRIIYASVST
ncbi:carbonic anhydrase 9 [Nephila pilipes]|uniref:carbonic anhydrase n=1 Tax=Nephila pilipes TaxID=299642 RepID=A0A8X6PAC9_NEPPI|nr:carbonic anhydrase 9 [Nephila pilipes]